VSIRRFVQVLLALSLLAALSGCVPGAGQFSGTSSALLDGKQRPTVGVVLDANGKATVGASSVRNFPEAGGGGRLEGYVAQSAGPVMFTQLQTFRFDDSTTVRWLKGSLPIDQPWGERYPKRARLWVRGTAAGLLVVRLEQVRDTEAPPQPPLEADRPQQVVFLQPQGRTGSAIESVPPPQRPRSRGSGESPTLAPPKPLSLPPGEARDLEALLTADRWLAVRGQYGVVKGIVRGLKADPVPASPAAGQSLTPSADRVFWGVDAQVSAQESGTPVKRWIRYVLPSEAASLRSVEGTILALYRPGDSARSDSFPGEPVYVHFFIGERDLYVTSIQEAP
jgi:hypothetical protein